MNLVLVGYRGTGKSAVASALGRELGREVVSLDQEIARAAGQSIPEIVKAQGWDRFRDLETEVCRVACARDGLILDCGGGVVEREANFELLRRNGRVYWLKASPAAIVARIGGDTGRPSLTGTGSFTEEVEEVLARRTPLYRRLAHEEVETEGRVIREIARDVARRFRRAQRSAP